MSVPIIQHEIHAHSMEGSAALLKIVEPCLREEERREAFNHFYEVLKAMLLSYETKVSRMRRRIKPSEN